MAARHPNPHGNSAQHASAGRNSVLCRSGATAAPARPLAEEDGLGVVASDGELAKYADHLRYRCRMPYAPSVCIRVASVDAHCTGVATGRERGCGVGVLGGVDAAPCALAGTGAGACDYQSG